MNYRIAVDLDEVLVPFLKPMIKWKKRDIPNNRMRKYVYRDVFQVSEFVSKNMVEHFYNSEDFYNLQPIENSQEIIKKLKDSDKKLYVVTGRQDIVREKTEDWVNRYFPGVFEDVILTNSYTPNEIQKESICKAINTKTIIDDNFNTCATCMDYGIDSINYIGDPQYPWCFVSNISVNNWKEFEKYYL